MNATGKRRLLKLAGFLETASIPKKRFDMNSWAENRDGETADPKLIDCGTAACACGWATTIPAFRRAGFHLVDDPATPSQPDIVFRDSGGFRWRNGDAVEAFFDLGGDEVERLFMPESYSSPPTPKQVAKRIRAFVAKQDAEAKSTRPAR